MYHKESKRNKKEGKSILNVVERLGMHRVKNKLKRDYCGDVSLDKKTNKKPPQNNNNKKTPPKKTTKNPNNETRKVILTGLVTHSQK